MGDSLEIIVPDPTVDKTPTVWLIRQALRLLNSEGKAAEVAYTHVVELLRTRDDASRTLFNLLRSTQLEDVGLRWSTLHLAGDVGDLETADRLFRAAIQSLPKPREEEESCEGPRDSELLIRTMAVEALQRVAVRHPEAGELILRVLAERPAQPVLIEAVKAARELRLTDKARELLGAEDSWILDIKIRPAQELMAEPEREDDTVVTRTPPGIQVAVTAPKTDRCSPRKEG